MSASTDDAATKGRSGPREAKSVPHLTLLTNTQGDLTKTFELVDGKLKKTVAGQLYEGVGQQVRIPNLQFLGDVIFRLSPNQAVTYGITKDETVTIKTLKTMEQIPGSVARAAAHFKFSRGPGFLFFDGDAKHFRRKVTTPEEFRNVLIEIEPALEDAPMLIMQSASTSIYNKETGEQLIGTGGFHCLIPVKTATDIPRVGNVVYQKSWNHELGSYDISKNGSLLQRSVVDQMVFQAERIDFAAGAKCKPPLEQRRPKPIVFGDPSALFDSTRIKDLTVAEKRTAAEAQRIAKAAKAPEAKLIYAQWKADRAKEIAEERGCSMEEAVEIVERATEGGHLLPDFVLYPHNGKAVTVGEVLADPDKWDGIRCASPFEHGPEDDPRSAQLNLKGPKGPILYSFAHGTTYTLGEHDPSWKKKLRIEGEKGSRIRDEENVRIVLDNDPQLTGVYGYDEFAESLVLAKAIPGTREKGDYPRQWSDVDSMAMLHYFQRSVLPRLARDKLEATLEQHAKETASFHPVRDMLNAFKWDGTPRLNVWLKTYLGAHDAPDEYLHAVGAATLIGGVARIFRPGAKNDCALVLESAQGVKKSTLAETLAMREEWFSDSLPGDLDSKDARDHVVGMWIIELSELSQLRKSEIESVKSFMSRKTEIYRPPYGRHKVRYPRQCFFIGSTNNSEYLVDPTGNRRFWPVKCGVVNIETLLRDREQLWAEAVHRYKAGEKWYLDPEVAALANAETEKRTVSDPWLKLVSNAMPCPMNFEPVFTSAGEVLESMEIDKSQRHPAAAARVGGLLEKLGWTRVHRDRERGQLFRMNSIEVSTNFRERVGLPPRKKTKSKTKSAPPPTGRRKATSRPTRVKR